MNCLWITVHRAQERADLAQRRFDEALRELRLADLALADAERQWREREPS